MENNADMGFEFDWDSEIKNDSEFIVLPEGDYDFVVKGFERGRHNGSEKLPPCNKAILKIEIGDGQGKKVTIEHNLFLHSSCEWRLCAFFESIGARRHGEPLRMNWNNVVGAKGRCKVYVDEFKSNRTGETLKSNKISKFYPPTAASAQQASATQTSMAGFTPGRF